MQSASNEYKEIMNRPIRNTGHMTISIGVVNQEAQADAYFKGNYTYWSNKSYPFGNREVQCRYATMEQNYLKADGNMLFVPESSNGQFKNVGAETNALLGSAVVDFGTKYNIKGLTIDFGECYPTAFDVISEKGTFSYTNDNQNFCTTDLLGDTEYLVIMPTSMIGGQQRLRINNITMGVGINFNDDDIISSNYEEFVHSVCEELPSIDYTVTVADQNNMFNVDDNNSFINFLETMQKISVSVGLELDDGTTEWIEKGNVYLYDWQSQKGYMTFTAKDIISFLTDTYSDGNTIHSRTLFDDAVAVLSDLGFEPDEYSLDECLKDITITNPLPEVTHAECLQLISNAGRCILFQNTEGRICMRANFANVLDPDDMTVTSNNASAWSHLDNVVKGTEYVYADMTNNFFSADGSMFFMPENSSYLGTSFSSASVADSTGLFETNPTLTIELSAGYIYYSIYANFDGNPPKEMIVRTYYNGELEDTVTFNDLEKESILNHEFQTFDKMVFEFTKASSNDRVLVNKISFGDLSNYTLRKKDMLEEPFGYSEKKTKAVAVKVFSFQNNSEGNPEQIDDSVYESKSINTVGEVITFENQLISTSAHAQQIAEWLGNYYANNVSYDVSYRGEPRLNSPDIIYMESDVLSNLQVEVTKNNFTYNGAFGGSLELRRALRMMEVS